MKRPFYIFINRVYPPVAGATGELLKELAEGLARAGARVVVITSRGPATLHLPKRGETNGVEVIRVGSAPFTRASHWQRAVSYAGLYPQLAWRLRRLGQADAVVSMTDPPLQVAAVTLASGRARKKIHWAQDVYPELAEELGVIARGGMMARVLRAISNRALRKQDEIVAVGRCMRERLIARGVDASQIQVIPNWSPVGAVPVEEAAAMRRQHGWDDDFVALYSGNLGLAHDFETFLQAAKSLEGAGVRMVFAGEGPRLEEVRRAAAGLAHVSFLAPQAKENLGAFLAAADVHLVTVRSGLEGLVVPSKIYGILAAGRPVVYVGPSNSEAARLLTETNAGVVIAQGNAAGLAAFLRNAATDPQVMCPMISAAREAARDFTFAKALAKWQEVLG